MEFDNEIPSEPTFGSQVRSHLPILLVFGGAAAMFVGLHTAASSVAVLAVLHVAIGFALFAFRRHRNNAAIRATVGAGE